MNKLQKEAIAHYDRMIEWAKTQPRKKYPSYLWMEYNIGESWFENCCPYCKKYYYAVYCPLRGWNQELFAGMCASTNCCNGLWRKMHEAETWGEWIKYAEKVKQYIKENG